jgi:hypothetical protein
LLNQILYLISPQTLELNLIALKPQNLAILKE